MKKALIITLAVALLATFTLPAAAGDKLLALGSDAHAATPPDKLTLEDIYRPNIGVFLYNKDGSCSPINKSFAKSLQEKAMKSQSGKSDVITQYYVEDDFTHIGKAGKVVLVTTQLGTNRIFKVNKRTGAFMFERLAMFPSDIEYSSTMVDIEFTHRKRVKGKTVAALIETNLPPGKYLLATINKIGMKAGTGMPLTRNGAVFPFEVD